MFSDLMADRPPAAEVRAFGLRDFLLGEYDKIADVEQWVELDVARQQTTTRVAGDLMSGVALRRRLRLARRAAGGRRHPAGRHRHRRAHDPGRPVVPRRAHAVAEQAVRGGPVLRRLRGLLRARARARPARRHRADPGGVRAHHRRRTVDLHLPGRRAPPRCPTWTSTSRRARSSPSSGRTAPARPRSPGCSPGSTRPTPARSPGTAATCPAWTPTSCAGASR